MISKLTDEQRSLLYKIRDHIYVSRGIVVNAIDDTIGCGMYNDDTKNILNYWRSIYLQKK